MKLHVVRQTSLVGSRNHVTVTVHVGGQPPPKYGQTIQEFRTSSCRPAGEIVAMLERKLKKEHKGKGVQFMRPVYHAPRPPVPQLTEAEADFLTLIYLNQPALRHAD